MKGTAIVIMMTLGAAGVARAGAARPTKAEAKATAQAWLAALKAEDDDAPAKTAALTLAPFVSSAETDDGASCPLSTALDGAAAGKALDCLREHLYNEGDLKTWTKKVAKEDGVPHARKKELRALEKWATLVMLESECAGTFNQVALAVARDKDGALKVAAALSLNGTCGE
jgi:hypothetical protein